MTRDQALQIASHFFSYRDATPSIRGEADIHAFALLVAAAVYLKESQLIAGKAADVDGQAHVIKQCMENGA